MIIRVKNFGRIITANNPSNVDVLFDNDFFAIDFKRANNHDFRKSKQFENLKVGHHIGIYGYQKNPIKIM